jgi:hypothetical protein
MEDQPISRADGNAISALIATLGRQMESLSTRMDDLSNGKRLGRKNSWGKKVFDELSCPDEKATSEGVRSNQGNQQVNYDFGMINDIPFFYGGGEEFMNWEIEIDRFFSMNDVPEDKQAKKVAKKLKSTAAVWWDRLVVQRCRENKKSIRTWRKMKQYMRDRFLPKDYEKIIRRRKKLERDKEIQLYCDEEWKRVFARLSTITSSSSKVEFVDSGNKEEVFHMDDHNSNSKDVVLEEEIFDVPCDEDFKSSCGEFDGVVYEVSSVGDDDGDKDLKVEVQSFEGFVEKYQFYESALEDNNSLDKSYEDVKIQVQIF